MYGKKCKNSVAEIENNEATHDKINGNIKKGTRKET
jgi:hypothetical protein